MVSLEIFVQTVVFNNVYWIRRGEVTAGQRSLRKVKLILADAPVFVVQLVFFTNFDSKQVLNVVRFINTLQYSVAFVKHPLIVGIQLYVVTLFFLNTGQQMFNHPPFLTPSKLQLFS